LTPLLDETLIVDEVFDANDLDVELPGQEVFYAEVHLLGGPAPVRRFLPDLIRRIESHNIDPGQVFDLTLPLDQAAEGYRAMDERRSIKALLRP